MKISKQKQKHGAEREHQILSGFARKNKQDEKNGKNKGSNAQLLEVLGGASKTNPPA